MLIIRLYLKKVIAAAICLAGSVTMFAQDIITMKNGAEIRAVVFETGIDYVRYKRFDSQNSPTYRLRKSEISMIRYEDGSRDVFSSYRSYSKNNKFHSRNNYFGYDDHNVRFYSRKIKIYSGVKFGGNLSNTLMRGTVFKMGVSTSK